MNYLTVDFGSTYTKLTAIDAVGERVLGTASAFTTIETDVRDGLKKAMSQLESKIGEFKYDQLICCSSAAGGLKMLAIGLVPELTAKAARMAASSAGAKVIKTYSYEISEAEKEEIYQINPDLILLSGGTDGGNKEVIIANAQHLSQIDRDFSTIVAGNKSAAYEIEQILKESGKDYVITDNVMPSFNSINIDSAKQSIKSLFIRKIVDAKGLSKIQQMTEHKIIPTPLAVMTGCELLSIGTKTTEGLGDIMAVDLGGATTDIYSIAKGDPTISNVITKGLPEPYSKRTVEGDIGMRYSLHSLYEETDIEQLSLEIGITPEKITEWVEHCTQNPNTIAAENSPEIQIEERFAHRAIEIASERHCGIISSTYTPLGEVYTIEGKDLSRVPHVIGIGGAIINSKHPKKILEGAKYNNKSCNYMKPRQPKYLLDSKYIFAAMGLLSSVDPELALKIMLKEIKSIE